MGAGRESSATVQGQAREPCAAWPRRCWHCEPFSNAITAHIQTLGLFCWSKMTLLLHSSDSNEHFIDTLGLDLLSLGLRAVRTHVQLSIAQPGSSA